MSPALFAKVYEAFLEYQLIVFHDVDLPPGDPGRVRAQFRRGAGPRAQRPLRHQGPPGNLHAVQPRSRRQSERQAPGQGHAVLAHRRLLARAHRASDDDVFGDRAGRRRRNRIRRHVFGLRAVARGDAAADRRPARHPQSRFLAHPAPRRGFIDDGTKSQSAADRASDRAHRIPKPDARRFSSAITPKRSRVCPTTKAAR